MLIELHIEDLGVIDRLSLVLGRGMTALTGETGAGKTMLVEAISLLVGGRSDAAVVRPGAVEARVEGRFLIDHEEVVLARVIPVDGRSRAYVNGRLATAATLAEVGAKAIDLHGQHSHQSLLSTATQRAALDRFGGIDHAPLRAARARLTEIDAALAALGGDSRARAREIDLLRYQVAELDAARLERDDEELELGSLEDTLAGAVAHREAAHSAIEALTGDAATIDSLGVAIAAIAHRSPFTAITERLLAASVELADAAGELRDRVERIDEDPERLQEVRLRRQLLRDLRKKYGESLAEVMTFHAGASARLEELEGYEGHAASLERDRQVALEAEGAAARTVGRARRQAAPAIAAQVEAHLRELAMPHASVAVEVGRTPDEDPGDDVTFLLAANPGSPLLPLTRVASGGELARAMLALRLVLTSGPDTLVFDEVDAGVGGAAGSTIGDALARLGSDHQVLVVTHLAQVAAAATTQIAVTKTVTDGDTIATAREVTGDDRVTEIARMLSGEMASKSAREHAAALIESRQRR